MAVRRVVSAAEALRRVIVYAAGVVIVACTAVMGTTLMLGVLVRYLLGGSLPWASELTVMLFPWLIMAGIVVAAARNGHLGVDYLVQKLPPLGRRLVGLLNIALIIALMLGLAGQIPGIVQFMQYQTTPVLGWPATYAFYSVPCGLLAVALTALLRVPEVLLASDRAAGQRQESL